MWVKIKLSRSGKTPCRYFSITASPWTATSIWSPTSRSWLMKLPKKIRKMCMLSAWESAQKIRVKYIRQFLGRCSGRRIVTATWSRNIRFLEKVILILLRWVKVGCWPGIWYRIVTWESTRCTTIWLWRLRSREWWKLRIASRASGATCWQPLRRMEPCFHFFKTT